MSHNLLKLSSARQKLGWNTVHSIYYARPVLTCNKFVLLVVVVVVEEGDIL